jgi:hypothetical protein
MNLSIKLLHSPRSITISSRTRVFRYFSEPLNVLFSAIGHSGDEGTTPEVRRSHSGYRNAPGVVGLAGGSPSTFRSRRDFPMAPASTLLLAEAPLRATGGLSTLLGQANLRVALSTSSPSYN